MPTIDTVTLEPEVTRLAPALVEIRRTIHQAPELGFEEAQTAALVAERLKALGLEVQAGVAKTGACPTSSRPSPAASPSSARRTRRGGSTTPTIPPGFDFDEAALPIGVQLLVRMTERYLGNGVS